MVTEDAVVLRLRISHAAGCARLSAAAARSVVGSSAAMLSEKERAYDATAAAFPFPSSPAAATASMSLLHKLRHLAAVANSAMSRTVTAKQIWDNARAQVRQNEVDEAQEGQARSPSCERSYLSPCFAVQTLSTPPLLCFHLCFFPLLALSLSFLDLVVRSFFLLASKLPSPNFVILLFPSLPSV